MAPNADTKRTLLSWSSGKDSAYALDVLREDAGVEVVGLVTTLNGAHDRVAMHGVRRSLLRAQATAAGLPLLEIDLPADCTNEEYERRCAEALTGAEADAMAFGDLFLEDVRAYRERQCADVGLEPLFPLWGEDTRLLSARMIERGLRAVLTCIDPRTMERDEIGAEYDAELLRRLPAGVDPCGERGEFHTFTYDAPCFERPVRVERGEVVDRGGFTFIDLDLTRDLAS